jgi:hypothetical protein
MKSKIIEQVYEIARRVVLAKCPDEGEFYDVIWSSLKDSLENAVVDVLDGKVELDSALRYEGYGIVGAETLRFYTPGILALIASVLSTLSVVGYSNPEELSRLVRNHIRKYGETFAVPMPLARHIEQNVTDFVLRMPEGLGGVEAKTALKPLVAEPTAGEGLDLASELPDVLRIATRKGELCFYVNSHELSPISETDRNVLPDIFLLAAAKREGISSLNWERDLLMEEKRQHLSRARNFLFNHQYPLRGKVENPKETIKASGRKDKNLSLKIFDVIQVDSSVSEYRCHDKELVKEGLQQWKRGFPPDPEVFYKNLKLMGRHIYLYLKATRTIGIDCEDKEWKVLLRNGVQMLEGMRFDKGKIAFLTKLLLADVASPLPHPQQLSSTLC